MLLFLFAFSGGVLRDRNCIYGRRVDMILILSGLIFLGVILSLVAIEGTWGRAKR